MNITPESNPDEGSLREIIDQPQREAYVFETNHGVRASLQQSLTGVGAPTQILPGIHPANLGDLSFLRRHAVSLPYISGEMANGIATVEMVAAMAQSRLLGFFGSAGLTPERIERSVIELQSRCGDRSWGANLIHSPNDGALEEKTVDLFLRHQVRRVSASAFMAVRPSVVRYSYSGIKLRPDGSIERPNHIVAKLSRPEVARQFMSPGPEAILRKLVEQRQLTSEEAQLARTLPVAEDITAEADSGGHTDNRPLTVLLPSLLAVREQLASKYSFPRPIRIGAAGGIGTPAAVSAAFALGASYVLTGSINQSSVESGLSREGKKLLAEAGMADIMMAPAGDMFELGVKVQVLKRGTLFGVRAAKLYDIYTRFESLEQLPAALVTSLEKDFFQQSLDSVWAETNRYFMQFKPEEITRAMKEPKHRMALVFRWYLGLSSRWAIDGESNRRFDYQIWCGPAMGAFNEWVAGSFLEKLENRTVTQIAWNVMFGAASIARAQQLRLAGLNVPSSAFHFSPRELRGVSQMMEANANA